ncbi:MAG: DUF4199 domain-containing protein [Stagnimonas sp.]|nr:DUF4199 domain-containing protein [Stagnimonas sp.]
MLIKKILPYGAAAGLIAGVPLSLMGLNIGGQLSSSLGMALGYLTMLVAFSLIFVAIKRRRDQDQGGVIRFWPALGQGLGISLVASVCYALCWETALALSGMDFAGEYAKLLIEQQRAQGVSGEALAAFTAEMEQFKTQYADPLYRLPMTLAEIFPVGLLVSLVSAGLLRNPRFLAAPRG